VTAGLVCRAFAVPEPLQSTVNPGVSA
jgi:hypothetical protein